MLPSNCLRACQEWIDGPTGRTTDSVDSEGLSPLVDSGDTPSQDCLNLLPLPWMVYGGAGLKETFFCDVPLDPMYFTADCLPLPG